MKTLGIDLGSNSLGWAILDDATGEFLDRGVVVFPEGVTEKDDLETPAATRRTARMGRRLKFRRKLRKWALLKILIAEGMCPMTAEELAAWKENGVYPVGNRAFLDWLKATDSANPYVDRAAAASGPVSPLVLGRALYHLCQRRGFLSNRKDAAEEDGAEGEDEETATKKVKKTKPAKNADKKSGVVKRDIDALTAEIADSGCETLGQYFASRLAVHQGLPARIRVRGRHTGRKQHYEKEFAVIMEKQGVAPDLRRRLHNAIFFQRPLRSQSHLVGNCPLEPASPRCLISHPDYEEFRMLCFVNNLTFEKVDDPTSRIPLSAADRALVCAAFDRVSPSFKFEAISKKFAKRFKAEGLKFHYYRDDESLSACSMRTRLKKIFDAVAFDEQKVFDALTFFDNDEPLARWFRRHYPALSSDQVAALVAIHPKEGNAQYSLKAIRKMLPFLRKGRMLSDARLMARLPDLIPDFAEKEEGIWTLLQESRLAVRQDREAHRNGERPRDAKPLLLNNLFLDGLATRFDLDAEKAKTLYLHGDSIYEKPGDGILPRVELGMIRNPLVQRSMTILRRTVNALRKGGKIDEATTIRIELAREVNDFATRHAIKEWQKEREEERAEARAELAKYTKSVSEDAIDRYILAEEQNWQCLYTGNTIKIADLINGTAFDIEHTVPRSRSGDDSLANKTICDLDYNRKRKQGRLPTECDNWEEISVRLERWREKREALEKDFAKQNAAAKHATDPEAKSKARIKALVTRLERDYWRDKIKRFEVTAETLTDPKVGLSGFKKRQLVDTGVMCSHAVEFLKSVYPKTSPVNGTATAFARKAWGIQGEDAAKDRSSHVHHAKDAMVIAALTQGRFNAICSALKDDGATDRKRPCDVCPKPYPNFAETVRKACEGILVKHVVRANTLKPSHRSTRLAVPHESAKEPGKMVKCVIGRGDTIRGQLHADTFYGCIVDPNDGKQKFVVRKSLVGALFSGAMNNAFKIAEKIVDPAIREIVQERLKELQAQGKRSVEAGDITMKSGVPINRVRIFAQTTNPIALRPHAIASEKDYKKPYYVTLTAGSNFRMALFKKGAKVTAEPESSLVWAQAHKRPDYVPLDRREGFIGSVVPGALALTYDQSPDELKAMPPKDLARRLYKVVKFRGDGLITFRLHTEARAATDLGKDLKAAGKHAAGESRIAYDRPNELLLLSSGTYGDHVLFEGIHFTMGLDGTITFLS